MNKTKEELQELANKFIKASNVHGIVYAKEGGVIELSSLLIDFIKFIEINEQDKK